MTATAPALGFALPDELAAHEPPEARGLSRDAVRLMVSRVREDRIAHTRFSGLPDFLERGDIVVVNASATINAALPAIRTVAAAPGDVLLHLSTRLTPNRWVVELRRLSPKGSAPLLVAAPDEELMLPGEGRARLIEPYEPSRPLSGEGVRLWVAELSLAYDALTSTERYGSPIRYAYVPRPWPLSAYQTIFATEPGSAEMPSAGRPFTLATLEHLRRRGVHLAPLVLHTGVSSLESHEPPYPEHYRVPATTALAVNAAKARGGRVVAVGSTVVRALETVAARDGRVGAGEGWTDLVIGADRPPFTVDALLTGLHAPDSSHLSMMEAFAGPEHLRRAYQSALRHRYRWHEFGDLHLMLP